MSDRPPRTAEEETEGRRLLADLAAAYRRLYATAAAGLDTSSNEGVMTARDQFEHQVVRFLGDQIGYGRTMQLAEEIWREKLTAQGLAGGEHTTGPCAAFMVACSHPVRDANGHCEVCCGCGRVTKWVAANLGPREVGR